MQDRFIKANYSKMPTEGLVELDLNEFDDSVALSEEGSADEQRLLRNFAVSLKRVMRGITFAWKDNHTNPTMWVYMKDKPYTMGYVGYGDFNTHVMAEESEYVVYSHTIENGKYSSYSTPYFMKKTIHMDKAVKNASRHLRNATPYELAMLNIHKAKSQFDHIGGGLQDKLRSIRDTLYDQDRIAQEFRAIIDSGHEFIDASFGTTVTEFLEAYDIAKARDNKTLNLNHVRVYMEDDAQMFDVIKMSDVHKNAHACLVPDSLMTYKDNELPEDIMGKVSVLTMVGNGEFVDDVGYKDDSGCFYVTQ